MPTLAYLIREQPQLQLRFLQPGQAALYGETQVSEVVCHATDATPGDLRGATAKAATLVRIVSPDRNSPVSPFLNGLIKILSEHKAAGLVIHVSKDAGNSLPDNSRALANSLRIPLLITSAPPAAWDGINDILQVQRTLFAERQFSHLEGLLQQLPARLADVEANQRIVDWLSKALQAEVSVTSELRGIAASPAVRHQVTSSTNPADEIAENRYLRVVPIMTGRADELSLTVSAPNPYDTAAARLIQHAARLLGLCDQARREHQAAPRSVRHATFQLLMAGETVLAQMIYTGGVKALLDTDAVRVYIIDTGQQERETMLRQLETGLCEAALVCPCPGKPRHILVLDPGHEGNRVDRFLKDTIRHRKGCFLGCGRAHPPAKAASSYMEALSAVAEAARSPERISLGGTGERFSALLPRSAANAWAKQLLAPLLDGPPHRNDERGELLKTLPIALGFRLTEAADALQIHRNTLRRRLSRAGDLLGLDLRHSVTNRILVLLALDILGLSDDEVKKGGGGQTSEFVKRLAAPSAANTVRIWTQERLRTIQGDAWAKELLAPLLHGPSSRKNERDEIINSLPIALGYRLGEAADALQIHPDTVRHRLCRAGDLLGLDLLNSASDSILVLLALDILGLPAGRVEETSTAIPDLSALITAQPTADAVKRWAEERLDTLQDGRKTVLETLCAYIENDLSLSETAAALGVSEGTASRRIRHASQELGIDLSTWAGLRYTDVVTIVDIALALYVLLGRPKLDPPRTPVPHCGAGEETVA